MAKLEIYSDGGARGNPGPAAIAFLIRKHDGSVLKEYSKCVGRKTNNQTEYMALIAALEYASKMTKDEICCYLDSELVSKHLTGEYQIKSSGLMTLYSRIQTLKLNFTKVSFVQVPRTNSNIQKVDALVNECLDRLLGG